MRIAAALLLLPALLSAADPNYPLPRFTDPDRVSKLQSVFPRMDDTFRRLAKDRGMPGLVWGVVIDGKLAHTGATGVQDVDSKRPVTKATAFRIASMTKSFTVLAILRLRDEGKLSLDDPISKWIPEFANMPMPTRDTAPLRVRQLLTHGAGFPEDNPWGDQQLGISDRELNGWLKQGLPFSTPPDTTYEYSNYGFGLLGRIVTQASGMPYPQFLTERILKPLGMNSSTLEPSEAAANARAMGYRRKPDGTYQEEPSLPHGAFGAMGGLVTTAEDMGRYVAFQLSAWPPRDDAENGPVKRSSVREMNHLWRPANLNVSKDGDKVRGSVDGYGYGLRITSSCDVQHMVGHGGGLPGFGSYMIWLPEYGVGLFGMSNLTYSGPTAALMETIGHMRDTGALQPRELPPAPRLIAMRDSIARLWNNWSDDALKRIAAMNLLLDSPAMERRAHAEKLREQMGKCAAPGPLRAENWLRGRFAMKCEKGTVGVTFTLAPTQPPLVQALSFEDGSDDRPGRRREQRISLANARCPE